MPNFLQAFVTLPQSFTYSKMIDFRLRLVESLTSLFMAEPPINTLKFSKIYPVGSDAKFEIIKNQRQFNIVKLLLW